MSSRTDFAISYATFAPSGTCESRAEALRAIFGPRAARAAVRFAMEAQEMGDEDVALAWMKTASVLVADRDETPFLH
jgi:hypothetical protein